MDRLLSSCLAVPALAVRAHSRVFVQVQFLFLPHHEQHHCCYHLHHQCQHQHDTMQSSTSSPSNGSHRHALRRREFLYTSAHWITALAEATCIGDLQLLLFELAAAVMPAAVDPVWHSYDITPNKYGNLTSTATTFAGASDSDYTTQGMHHADSCACPAPTPFMGSWKARETPRDCGRTVFTWLRRRVTSWPRRRHPGDVRSLVARAQAEDELSGASEPSVSANTSTAAAATNSYRDERNIPVVEHHWSICLLDQLEAWEIMRLARSGGRSPSVAFSYPQGAVGALHWGLRRHWMRRLIPEPPPPPMDSTLIGKSVAQLQLQPASIAALSQAELVLRMRQFERCLRLPVLMPFPSPRYEFFHLTAPLLWCRSFLHTTETEKRSACLHPP
jgi:hypothetical protein